MDTSTIKEKLNRFGRAMALLLNRCLMYQKSHPIVQGSIKETHQTAELLFYTISPVVLILNRDQFYVDEEPLDHRLNVSRIAQLFKNHGIQSVSFESGITQGEIDIFADIFSTMTPDTNAESIKKDLIKKGVYNVKINHVLYRKVTEDDQIVSREALKKVTPSLEEDDSESRKKFMDTLLETFLTDEFANTLNIKSLLANPGMVSKNMIQADLASAEKFSSEDGFMGTDGATGGAARHKGAGGTGIAGDLSGADTGISDGTGTGPTGTAGPSGTGIAVDGSSEGTGTGHGAETGTVETVSASDMGIAGDGSGEEAGTGHGIGTGTAETAGASGTGIAGTDGPGIGGGAGTGEAESAAADETVTVGSGTGEGVGTASTGQTSTDTVADIDSPDLIPATVISGTGYQGDSVSPGQKSSGSIQDKKGLALSTGKHHGHMLLHQLDIMQQEVQKHLEGGGDIALDELADAVFEMKKRLFEDIQAHKALGVAFTNESAIIDNVNDLTDQVLLKLIEEEYQNGNITTQRLAQIILRMIPEAKELKRLLPQIKQTLIDNGMSAATYLELMDELKKELQNEELTRILETSSEAIGVDSEELIEELKEDSDQAAKLIYLASEIRKGGGDEGALADLLVDYVEKMSHSEAEESDIESGGDHLKNVITKVESSVLTQLAQMDISPDVLLRMEDRINDRMENMLDKIRVEWLKSQSESTGKEKIVPLTVLQTLEHNIGEDEEMEEILKAVREKVEDGEIEENDYSQIHSEINRQKEILEAKISGLNTPDGVLAPKELIFIIEKEIARADRYQSPFSAMAFSFVKAKPKMKSLEGLITTELITSEALEKLVNTIREVDYIGQIGKNKMVALLPMIDLPRAKMALRRVMNLLNNEPLMVKEVPVQLRVAGVVSEFNSEQTQDAQSFAKALNNQLADMVFRLKNIQVLF